MFAWLRRVPVRVRGEKVRVLDALADYPPYEPPIWHSDTHSIEDAAAKYRTFFLKNRERRVEALRIFLAKFDVALSLEDAGVKAVSAWCPLYADLLVDGLQHRERDELWRAYNWFSAPWTGLLIGFNPIFDLGVYMGECLLYRNPRLKWHPYVNPELNKGAAHPILGRRGERTFDPINWTYTECKNIHSAKMAGENPSDTNFYGYMQARAKD